MVINGKSVKASNGLDIDVVSLSGAQALNTTSINTPGNWAKFVSTIPLGRFHQASDIAAAAILLTSGAAESITGVELPADGGRTV